MRNSNWNDRLCFWSGYCGKCWDADRGKSDRAGRPVYDGQCEAHGLSTGRILSVGRVCREQCEQCAKIQAEKKK